MIMSWFFSASNSSSHNHGTSSAQYAQQQQKAQKAAFYKNPPVGRRAPISEEEWMNSFDEEGRIIDPVMIRLKVFSGGACDAIRGSLWEFLLGVYAYRSTYAEREKKQRDNERRYNQMLQKLKWIQEHECLTNEHEESLLTIDKDVQRTDRDLSFYAGDDNVNLIKLKNILAVHAIIYRSQLPYIQGQNEFASMFLYVQNGAEADAFWCLARLMSFMGDFFLPEDKTAMNRQFHTLIGMIRDHEPSLYSRLATEDAADVLFAYRWMLLNLKREFSFKDALLVSEVIWSMPVQPYVKAQLDLGKNPYVLFICLAVIVEQGEVLKELGYDDIIMHMNTRAGNLDTNRILSLAECLYWKFTQGEIPSYRLKQR